MSTANRIIKNTGFLYAKMGITMFISLYTTRLILNVLGAADFGIFTIVGGAIAMLGFLNAAMASATQRFMSYSEGEGDKEKQKKIFNISIVLHYFIALILGVGLLIAGYFFFNGILKIEAGRIGAAKVVYGSLIISTMFTVMSVPYDAILNARENMLYYAIIGILESVLRLAVAMAVLCIAGDKLIIYGVLMAVIPLVIMTIMRVYCHRKYEECIIAPRKYWDKKLMIEMRNFAGWNFIESVSSMVGNYGKGIVINMFFGTIINAAVGVAMQLSGQLSVFAITMLKALNPLIAKSEGAGNRKMMLKSALIGIKLSFYLESLFFIPALMEMEYIQLLWLKTPPLYSSIFCQLMLINNLVGQLTITLPGAISAVGNIKKFTIYNSFFSITPLFINYLMFMSGYPPYSGIILAIVVTMLQNCIILYFSSIFCGLSIVRYIKETLIQCLIPFFISVLVCLAFELNLEKSNLRLILVIISSATSFMLGAWYIGFKPQERINILSNLKELLNGVISKRRDKVIYR